MEIIKWKELLAPYNLAVKELILKFEQIRQECYVEGRHSTIERVQGRVKSISSILAKASEKNIPLDRITEEIYDLAGIRLICQFVEDIDRVIRAIRTRTDMEVVEEKDYVHSRKVSGYSSYHMIIRYPVCTLYGSKTIFAEIQIRTMAMNYWSVIEHTLQYKYNGNLPPYISERLQAAADAVHDLESEMSAIRDEIISAQDMFADKERLVSEIRESIQNLYKFEHKDAITNIQNEFFYLHGNGTIDQLREFNDKLDKIAARYGVQALPKE